MTSTAAFDLLHAGRYGEAVGECDRGLDADPDNRDLLYARAECYRRLKDYGRAVADLDRLLNRHPDHLPSYRLRAVVHNKLCDYVRASDDLSRIIDLIPDDFEAHHIRGITYAKLGDYSAAVDDLTEAIRIDPSSSAAHRSRGLAYGHQKKYAMSLSDFNRALDLDPDTPYPVIRDRGCIQVHLHAFQAAIDDLSEAIQIEPTDVEAHRHRALAYYCLGQYQRCIGDSMTVLRYNRQDAQACLDIAKANFKLNRLSDAVPFLIDAVVIDSSHAPSVKKLLEKLLGNLQIDQQQRAPISEDHLRGASLGATVQVPPMPEPPEATPIDRFESKSPDERDSAAAAAAKGDPDLEETADDAAVRKRKAMLKQLLATKRLAEFRRQGQEKSDLRKKVEERQALTAKEVQQRAEQAIKLKREIERQFIRCQKDRETIKEDVEKEVDTWIRSLRLRPDSDRFRILVVNLPTLLLSPAFAELVHVCASFGASFQRNKAYREIARHIHPDKLKPEISARDACLAGTVWCVLSDAYSYHPHQ